MDSPGQISPSLSTPSSASPPGEEANYQAPVSGYDKGFMNTLTSQLSSFSNTGSSSKRRLGGGATHANASARDPKSRRRENSGRMDTMNWDVQKGPGGKREKDEFLDQSVVDFLRKEIGDPFQEPRS